MEKWRLDNELVKHGLVISRSQAENYIKLGKVKVNGKVITKAGFVVSTQDKIELTQTEQYVSRAGLKLASVAKILGLDFKDKIVLDVGSSTGGFTDFALQHGAKKVIAVDVGTDQLHPSLINNPKIELHEKTNILDVKPWMLDVGKKEQSNIYHLSFNMDIILVDVSFVSLRVILPHLAKLSTKDTQIVAMLKPQFEVGQDLKNKGVIKNQKMRRQIIKDFETWVKNYFVIIDKADSEVTGAKGNQERFYLLKSLK